MGSAGSPVPAVVCVDVEPASRHPDPSRPAPWDGFEPLHTLLSRLRRRLPSPNNGASYSWFFRLDPQVAEVYGDPAWPLRTFAGIVDEVVREGDEIGLHPHAWRWTEGQWLADHGSQDWVDHCVRTSFETLATTLGVSCRVFRMGDRWSSTATVNLLESLGVEIDLTAEPGKNASAGLMWKEPATGALPDYSSAPQQPYRPSWEDFLIPGAESRSITILPLTTRPIPVALRAICGGYHQVQRWRDVPVFNDYVASAIRVGLSLPPALFRYLVRGHLASEEPVYLAFAIHTDDGRSSGALSRIEANLAWLSTEPQGKSVVFVTAHEALAILAR